MAIEIKLPDLGEGIESGDVLDVLVNVGDEIAKDASLIEIETDKATVEVPSTQGGKVVKIHVSAGDKVKVGDIIATLEAAGAATPAPPAKPAPPVEAAPEKPAPAEEPAAEAAEEAPVEQQPAPKPQPAPAAAKAPAASAVKTKPTEPAPPQAAPAVAVASDRAAGATVAAGPAVRRFAREVGVDLESVSGSGPGGRITRDDVLAVVRQANKAVQGGKATKAAAPAVTATAAEPADEPTLPGEPGQDNWGPVRRERMSKIRRTIAAKMHESWSTVPRVTNFDDADVTELEKIRQTSKADYAETGIKLTTMPFVIKACALALEQHPLLNASLDMENEQVVYKDYVNIGIAVDSERGLVVPALRAVNEMSFSEIAQGLTDVANKVRDGSFKLEDLRGGTFTISNLGAIGGKYSTPIINVPEVAILLVGRSREMPVVRKGQIVPRLMMPLSLSYDHRLVDGATAGRFLNDVIAYLQAPSRLLLAP